ncbi:MAG: hypothetical protein ABI830_09060, partial [Pseudolabrys sp.]
MANNPQKSDEATQQALAAIQEALSVRPGDQRPVAPPVVADLFHQDQQDTAWDGDDTSPRRAANDDRANIGQILQALRRRPARMPYVIASFAALVWTAGGLATVYLFSAELQAAIAEPRVGLAALTGIAAAIIVPVIFFYVIAHMFSRSQDMRLVAESMAEVAMRLAQPETSARESIVSIGQAIRREVTAMGDGVERALARAAE